MATAPLAWRRHPSVVHHTVDVLNTTEVKLIAYADDIAIFVMIRKVSLKSHHWLKHSARYLEQQIPGRNAAGSGTTRGLPHQQCSKVFIEAKPGKYIEMPLKCRRNCQVYWSVISLQFRGKVSHWIKCELSIFANATVCNFFVVVKMFHLLQIPRLSRMRTQKFRSNNVRFI